MTNNSYATAHPQQGPSRGNSGIGNLKKRTAMLVLAGLFLTGCGSSQAETGSAAAAAIAAATAEVVTVPGVVGLTLDVATEQLEDLGFEVEAVDSAEGKPIIEEKDWLVISQDPAEAAQVPEGSTVRLEVKSLEKLAAEKAAADKLAAEAAAAAEKAAAEQAALAAAAQAAAEQAARDAAARQAAEHAAAQQAAAQQAAQQAARQAALVPAPAPAPAAAPFANCAAARAAGAAPVYAGAPGYGPHLDRDRDGVGCE